MSGDPPPPARPGQQYSLQRDVDLRSTGTGGNVWGSVGFASIGTVNSPFRGQFEGNYEIISNLTIRQPSATDVGLFGHVSTTAAVRDLGLSKSSVSGSEDVGVLIGLNSGVVSQSYVTGSVSGGNNVGDLTGTSAGSIDDSYSTAQVSGTSSRSELGLHQYLVPAFGLLSAVGIVR